MLLILLVRVWQAHACRPSQTRIHTYIHTYTDFPVGVISVGGSPNVIWGAYLCHTLLLKDKSCTVNAYP